MDSSIQDRLGGYDAVVDRGIRIDFWAGEWPEGGWGGHVALVFFVSLSSRAAQPANAGARPGRTMCEKVPCISEFCTSWANCCTG